MPAYTPFYQPPTSQQAFLTREQKRERKRRRDGSDDGDEQTDKEQIPEPKNDTQRVPHPVNRTDPYHVAGHSRAKPLPPGNFPHAAIKPPRSSEPTVEQELANLNPPLFTPKVPQQDQSSSFRRRHMDNLTAILHNCILHQDWDRASRVWGLILRTEISGYGPDIRRNGHWTIGAEILMRRGQSLKHSSSHQHEHDHEPSNVHPFEDNAAPTLPVIADADFELARKYYERLILQYPDRPRAPHSTTNALAIYPALFSVWIYQVQDKANHSRQRILSLHEDVVPDEDSDRGDGVLSDASSSKRALFQTASRELEGASAISRRLDDLMLNPPYDTSAELLRIRGMVGLWLYDLHRDLSVMLAAGEGESTSDSEHSVSSWQERDAQTARTWHRHQADLEKQKARRVFGKMASAARYVMSTHTQGLLNVDDESGVQ